MPAFHYAALDTEGGSHKGLLEGDTARQVRQQLRDRGLTPLEVREASPRRSRGGQRHGRISATELALLTRQLATLINSALSVERALAAVAEQTGKARLSGLLLAVRARVLEGQTLASALDEFPHTFPDLYRATVAAGEQSGHLAAVFERLADYTESRQQLHQKISLALVYPVLLTGVAVTIVIGLLAYVVPQVVQVFVSTGQTLPALTRGLIVLSDFLRDYGVLLAVIVLLAVVGTALLLRRPGPKQQWQRWQLRLPLLGRLLRGINTARFARTLSILSASGVPVLDALRISAQVLSNLPMRMAVERAAGRVKEGEGLQQALSSSGYFPPLTLQLIASGEASGKLEPMLERAAQQQERETETLISAVLALFEPLLILLMGGIVLTIVLAILLPIFELNQMVR
ncbi:MAG: type II secretion system inner membrane protein GspF [Candidatus Competibacteraceae bacterium]|nr:type II secretion system inner membrane protein GspF [Candidatus Competibacteraceae bacterium]MCB1812443.1 type II secretion system inner membrane protein GspF [Candidatus Competibacteraceae bacterium]